MRIDPEKVRKNYQTIFDGKRVLLKFRASETEGLGHLSRMITLADYLLKNGCNLLCAINSFEKAEKILKKEGLDVVVNDSLSDEEFLRGVADDYKPDLIAIDEKRNYSVNFLKKLKEQSKLICIDRIAEGYEVFDWIIMPNAHFNPEKYKGFENILWGWDWVLISKEILKLKPKESLPKEIKTIVVTTGGSDPKGVLFYIVEWLKECKKDVILLVGESFKHRQRLKTIGLQDNFRLVEYDPTYLLKGDIAISTFGVSVYELIYLNVPVFCVGHTKENAEACDTLAKRCNLVRSLGYFEEVNSLQLSPKRKGNEYEKNYKKKRN